MFGVVKCEPYVYVACESIKIYEVWILHNTFCQMYWTFLVLLLDLCNDFSCHGRSGPQWGGFPGGDGAAELNGLQRQTGKPSGPDQHRRKPHHCYTTSAQSLTHTHTHTCTPLLICAHINTQENAHVLRFAHKQLHSNIRIINLTFIKQGTC